MLLSHQRKINVKVNITKSRAGHYTATAKWAGWTVLKRGLLNLEEARYYTKRAWRVVEEDRDTLLRLYETYYNAQEGHTEDQAFNLLDDRIAEIRKEILR